MERRLKVNYPQLCNHSHAPAISALYLLDSDHEENHLAACYPPNPRAASETERLLAKLDEIAVESLRAENFEEKGAQDDTY